MRPAVVYSIKLDDFREEQLMGQFVQVQRDGVEAAHPPTAPDVGDKQLIKQINDGDPAALEILYERYAPAVMGLAVKMLGDRTTAEEIVQETFWRVWKKAPNMFHPGLLN